MSSSGWDNVLPSCLLFQGVPQPRLIQTKSCSPMMASVLFLCDTWLICNYLFISMIIPTTSCVVSLTKLEALWSQKIFLSTLLCVCVFISSLPSTQHSRNICWMDVWIINFKWIGKNKATKIKSQENKHLVPTRMWWHLFWIYLNHSLTYNFNLHLSNEISYCLVTQN